MNNREKFQKKIENGDFMHINGSVLRACSVSFQREKKWYNGINKTMKAVK